MYLLFILIINNLCFNLSMSNNFDYNRDLHHDENIQQDNSFEKGKVDLTRLVNRLNAEKKKERNSNIALSVAAVSAVTVFGIILSL